MNLLATGDGNTPLSPDELRDLILDLTIKEELNEFEFENILEARRWALSKVRNSSRSPLLRKPMCEAFTGACLIRRGDGQAVTEPGKEHRGSALPDSREPDGVARRCPLLGRASDLRTG